MKKSKRIFSLILAALLILSVSVVPALASEQSELESENEAIEEELSNQKSKLEELKSNITDLEEYIEALDAQITEIEAIIADYQAQAATLQTEIDALTVQIAEEEENLAEQYELMKMRIQYFYENGETSYLEALFDSGSFAETLSSLQYTVELTNYDREQMETIQTLIENIETQKTEQETKYAEVASLQAAQEDQQALVEEIKAEQEVKLAEAYNEEYEIEQLMADLEAEYEENKDRIDEIVAAYNAAKAAEEAAKNNSSSSGGSSSSSGSSSSGSSYTYDGATFLWPLPSPYLANCITSYFGYRSAASTGGIGSTNHQGIDIRAASGTTIYAVLDGVAVANGYNSGAGNYLILYHGNGLYTHYYHQKQTSPIAVGESVTQGQVIGYVGTTGSSTGNHLHIAVSLNSMWSNFVDPAPYLGI